MRHNDRAPRRSSTSYPIRAASCSLTCSMGSRTPPEVAGFNLILLRCFYRARRSRVPREGHFFDVAGLVQLVFTP